MLNGSRFIRNWIRAGTRFNDPSREKRHQEAIDELEKLLAEDSKSPLFTNSAKYFTSKKRRKKLKNLHEKITKDTLYNQAARELIGFKFENHAAWAIDDFGDPFEQVKQSVLTTQRVTEQYRTFTPFDNMRKSQRANKIMVQVYAAALNIDDFHIVNGWAAGYNLWKLNPYEAFNKAYSRSRGRPTNLKSESNHGGYTEKIEQFPLTIGREFAGVILESPPELQYEFPVGKKIIGYCMPWQVGCMAEVVGLPAMQCATMPDGFSYTEAAALPFAGHFLMNAINRTSDNRTPFTELNSRLYRSRFMSKERIKDNRHLVVGIGGLGSTLVQLLRALGGTVDVLCSEKSTELAKRIGADNIFTYNDKNAAQIIGDIHNANVEYTSSYNCSRGAKIPIEQWIGYVMEPQGRVISFDSPEMAIKDASSPVSTLFNWKYKLRRIEQQIESEINYHGEGQVRFKFATVKCDETNINEVSQMAGDGLIKPCIDSVFEFDDIEGAFDRLTRGGLRGKIIVNVAGNDAFEGSTGNAYYYNPDDHT